MNFKIDKKVNLEVLQEMGIDRQSLVAVEELAELQKAITKAIRYPESSTKPLRYIGVRSNLVEEMADVLIIIDQLRHYYKISEEEIQSVIEAKQERARKRMKEGVLA